MRIAIVLGLILLASPAPCRSAEPCREIHGRAIQYTADGILRIWNIGTRETFDVVDKKSSDLVLGRMSFPLGSSKVPVDWWNSKALVADFTVCPTGPYKQPHLPGYSQTARVTSIRNAHVVTRR